MTDVAEPVSENAKKKRHRNRVVLNPKKHNRVLPSIGSPLSPSRVGTGYKPVCKRAWEGDFEREDLFSQVNASTLGALQDFDDSDVEELAHMEPEVSPNKVDDVTNIETNKVDDITNIKTNLFPFDMTTNDKLVVSEEPDKHTIKSTNGLDSSDVTTEHKVIATHAPQIAWNVEQPKTKEKRNKNKTKNTWVQSFLSEEKNRRVLESVETVTDKKEEPAEDVGLAACDEVSGLGDCEVYENIQNSPKSPLTVSTEEQCTTARDVTDLKTRLLSLRHQQVYHPQKILKKFDLVTLFNRISLPDRPPPPYASQYPHRMYTVPCPGYREESIQASVQVFTPDELLMREVIEDGLTPLHLAAKLGQLHQIHLLISTGADVNAVDRHGRIPLMLAFNQQQVHMECIQTLVNDRSSLNQQVTDGATALHMACYLGHYNLVEYLLSKGADARIADGEGRLPIHWATHPSNPKSIQFIANRHPHIVNATDDANMTPLMWAAFHNQIACLSLLLSLGADVEEKDVEGKTANHWAVHRENAKCLRRLLRLESTFFRDHKGKTVLHQAAETGSVIAMKAVLALRRDAVSDSDKQARTPLHWAAVADQVEACKYLLDRGADAGQTDSSDRTPLDYALMKGHNYTVALFTCHETSVIDLSRSLQQEDTLSTLSHTNSFVSFQSQRAASALSSVSSRALPAQSRVYTAIRELEVLAYGSEMGLYEFRMQGPLHRVYMWLDISTSRVCWGRGKKNYFSDNFKASPLREVVTESTREERERCRRDMKGHKYYLFKIETELELMYVVAFNELAFTAWTDQLAKYLLYSPRSLVGLKRFLI